MTAPTPATTGTARRRSRSSAKAAGTRMETSIVGALAEHVDERIERRARNGALDRGDVSAFRSAHGGGICLESKDYGGRFLVGPWLTEVETERGNADALVGMVVAKRRGITDPLDQVCFMTLRDVIALVTGERPE